MPAEDLVLMRDSKQVFTSVSPEGLGFWDHGELGKLLHPFLLISGDP